MKIKKLSQEEYIKLFNKLKGNLRVELDKIGCHPSDTEEERKEKIHKAFNPDLPFFINIHDIDGTTRYIRK